MNRPASGEPPASPPTSQQPPPDGSPEARTEGPTAATNGPVDDDQDLEEVLAGVHEPGGTLAIALGAAHQFDVAPGGPKYDERNRMVLFAIAAAVTEGVPVGILFDPAEPEWPCVMFELPTGQVGWHLPQHGTPYDGHDTRTKYERIRAFQEGRHG